MLCDKVYLFRSIAFGINVFVYSRTDGVRYLAVHSSSVWNSVWSSAFVCMPHTGRPIEITERIWGSVRVHFRLNSICVRCIRKFKRRVWSWFCPCSLRGQCQTRAAFIDNVITLTNFAHFSLFVELFPHFRDVYDVRSAIVVCMVFFAACSILFKRIV